MECRDGVCFEKQAVNSFKYVDFYSTTHSASRAPSLAVIILYRGERDVVYDASSATYSRHPRESVLFLLNKPLQTRHNNNIIK